MPTTENISKKKKNSNAPNEFNPFNYFLVHSEGTSILSMGLTYFGILFINYCLGWPPSARAFSDGMAVLVVVIFGVLAFVIGIKAIIDITRIFPKFSCFGVLIVAIVVQLFIGLGIRYMVSPKNSSTTAAVIGIVLWTIVYLVLIKKLIALRSHANQRLQAIDSLSKKTVDSILERALIGYKILNNKKEAVRDLMAVNTLEGLVSVSFAHASNNILKNEKEFEKAAWFIESMLPFVQDENKKRSYEIQLKELSDKQK